MYAKALIRRAKAHEAMGHYKQALSDIQKANKADSANPDTQVGLKKGFPVHEAASLAAVQTAFAFGFDSVPILSESTVTFSPSVLQ